jgi:hypothetical protein
VDRAALDVALELNIPCGGWCPQGRKAEDGTIPQCYPLSETPSDLYRQRTHWNVRDADATLVLVWGTPAGGTRLTMDVCRKLDKQHLVLDLADESNLPAAVARAREWLTATCARGVLNVAGPRASEHPEVYDRARVFLRAVLGPL